MDSSTEPITVTVQQDGALFLQETAIPLAELASKLTAIAKAGYEEQLFVRADTSVPYGRVMEVMGLLNSAGYRKIGLDHRPPKDEAPRRTEMKYSLTTSLLLHASILLAALVMLPRPTPTRSSRRKR